MLLSAIEDQILASPATKFREFLDALQNELSLHHMATRLENTYRELVGATQHSEVQARNATGMATDVLDVLALSSELATVTNWHQLGINLGLPKHELDKIECDYQGNDRQRLEMLDKWLKQMPSAVWANVVSALKQMGENRVAENIHQKYVGSGGKSH